MKKKLTTILIILVAIAGIYYVLNKNKNYNESLTAIAAQKNSGVAVRTQKATVQELLLPYITNGNFAPKQEVTISTEAAGRVVQVLAEQGDHVKAGQVLAIIKGDRQDVALATARAVYNNAKNEVERFESALKTGGVTQQQMDQVKLQFVNAQNNLRSAELAVADVNVKASFAGIINKRSIEPGSYVNPGQALFEIVNISTLKLNVNVDEKNIRSVKLNQEVLVKSSVFPEQSWTGRVTFIAPKANASLNFPVELEIENKGSEELKAGMFGTATFGNDQAIQALVVPRTAFVGNISSNKIFVASNGKALLRDVIAGRNFGEFIEIISGIRNGETVITTGQINLLNDSPITIIN